MGTGNATIAVDVGGTFTDLCCMVDGPRGPELVWTKEPSTPKDPPLAVVRGTTKALGLSEVAAPAVERFLHGTTVATNAVLERKGGRIGLLLTNGFEDTLQMGRGHRSEMYRLDAEAETPAFLAPGRRSIGIHQRRAADGSVVVPLDEEQVVEAVTYLVEVERVEAIGVCYLFSYAEPADELRTRELIAARYPQVHVSLSHEVDPVFREYERTCSTAFDAYLRPVVGRYLASLRDRLRGIEVASPVLTMQSRGGLASTTMASARPVSVLLSGPAAGVIGAKWVADRSGYSDCITLDMGGTSADIALIRQGMALSTTAGRIERYPLRTPMVDVSTIGAGGGSIAWLDPAGGLRVGPQSAGAEPGPACYRRGGNDATVTDANLVLGYLDPAHFAGGITIDPEAAFRAVERIATRIGRSVPETASAIHRVVNARMADATRLVSLKRGYDPRDFTLVLFGGAGPVNGPAVALEIGIRRLLIPFAPGALSAFGLMAAPLEYDDAITFKVQALKADTDELEARFRDLETRGNARMREDRVPLGDVTVRRSADMRYVGQSFELNVPLPARMNTRAIVDAIDAFHLAHEHIYGRAQKENAVEFVNLRTVHSYTLPIDLQGMRMPARRSGASGSTTRPCYFPELGGYHPTPILMRDSLAPGDTLTGPVVIHQADSSIVLGPQFTAFVDQWDNIIAEVRE